MMSINNIYGQKIRRLTYINAIRNFKINIRNILILVFGIILAEKILTQEGKNIQILLLNHSLTNKTE